MQARIARWRECFARFFVTRGNGYVLLAFAVTALGIFALARPTFALDMNDVTEAALSVIGWICSMIIFLLGKLIIIVVNILIGFAQYNGFVTSGAVTLGWPLVRDMVNMFFIVVLLVSAFATIVRYKEFHYATVLPKLLLMAVLINFSKTLIGLLIDFSQVIMITFVSAFAQAAGGNFMSALRLNEMTNLGENYAKGDATNYKPAELVVASMLAVVLMLIALLLIVYMTVFLALRIVVLWILLILSPIAFFALALPDKMKKAFSAFTDDFWSKLSSMLIAGPVMAFFLWLALAIAQQGGDGFIAIKDTDAANDAAAKAKMVNNVGKPSSLAAFTVAVVLMYLGVDFAKKTAAQVPGMARAVGAARGVPGMAARATIGITRGAARVAGKGARAGFEGVDRLADIRGKIGKAGLAVSGRLGGVGAGAFAGMAGYRGARIKEKRGALEKVTENLDEKTAQQYLRKRASSKVFTREAAAAQMSLADRASNSLSQRTLRDQYFESLKKERPDITNDADRMAMAEAKAKQQRGADLKVGKDVAGRFGFDDKMEKYVDVLKKDVGLSADWTDAADVKNGSVTDVKRYLGGVPASIAQDSLSMLAHMKAVGGVNDNGTVNADSEGYQKFMTGGRGEFGKEILGQLTQQQIAAQLASMDGKAIEGMSVEDTLKLANDSRMSAAKDKGGNVGSVFVNRAAGAAAAGAPGPRGGLRRGSLPGVDEEALAKAKAQIAQLKSEDKKFEGAGMILPAAAGVALAGGAMAAGRERTGPPEELAAPMDKLSLDFDYDEKDLENRSKKRKAENEEKWKLDDEYIAALVKRREAGAKALQAGGNLEEAFDFDRSTGKFTSEMGKEAFTNHVWKDGVIKTDKGDFSGIEAMDTGALLARPNEDNEARLVAAASISKDVLLKAYEKAEATGNQTLKRKVQALTQAILHESARLEQKAKAANLSMDEISKEYNSWDPKKAVEHGRDMRDDPMMSVVSGRVGGRAAKKARVRPGSETKT